MKIAFVVNDIATEKTNYTTTHLALAAERRGHEVWYIDVSGFAFDAEGTILAHAVCPSTLGHETPKAFIEDVQSNESTKEPVIVDSLDVLMLRNDPAEDVVKRP